LSELTFLISSGIFTCSYESGMAKRIELNLIIKNQQELAAARFASKRTNFNSNFILVQNICSNNLSQTVNYN